MVLDNYISFIPGFPKRLHFTSHALVTKEIQDPLLGRAKPVTSLVFTVDREDGAPVAKTLSVVSERLATSLEPYLEDGAYRSLDFTITKTGAGFRTRYSVQVDQARA